MSSDDRQLREKIELLSGDRPGAMSRAAVRIEDLKALLEIRDLKSARAAGSTPTKAEHDALVADLEAIHATLRRLHDALQRRILS